MTTPDNEDTTSGDAASTEATSTDAAADAVERELGWLAFAIRSFVVVFLATNLFEVLRSGPSSTAMYLFSIRHQVRATLGFAMMAAAAMAAYFGPGSSRTDKVAMAAGVVAIPFMLPRASFWLNLFVVLRGARHLRAEGFPLLGRWKA